MLNFSGAPWKIGAVNFSNGTYVGGILTLVVGLRTGWLFLRSRIKPWSLEGFALALLLFTSATGFLVAIGRGDMGMVQARSSRFFTGSETMQCATITLLLLWLIEIKRETLIRRFAMPVLVAAALLMLPSQVKAISASIQIHRRLEVTRKVLVAQTQNSATRQDLKQSLASNLGNLEFLVNHHLYGF